MLASLTSLFAEFIRNLFQITGSGHTPLLEAEHGRQLSPKNTDETAVVSPTEWDSVIQLAEALSMPSHAQPTRVVSTCAAVPERTARRLLASQLAVTSRLNVKKGCKPAKIGQRPKKTGERRTATTSRAKPTIKIILKKRAPKRRHVWLCAQIRVVRTITSNVTPLQHASHSPGRSAANRQNHRSLRLAA
jgi:hypothetical protein